MSIYNITPGEQARERQVRQTWGSSAGQYAGKPALLIYQSPACFTDRSQSLQNRLLAVTKASVRDLGATNYSTKHRLPLHDIVSYSVSHDGEGFLINALMNGIRSANFVLKLTNFVSKLTILY